MILTRDENRKLHAFYNVCRHRGTRLCTEPAGDFKGSIQCPYHAWTYRLDGTLRVARNMQDDPAFDAADFPLQQAHLAEFDGFVFISLNPEGSFAESFAALHRRFDAWRLGELKRANRLRYDVACNWKLVFQNYSECYHCPVIHPQLERLSPSDSGRNNLTDGAVLGGYSEFHSAAESLTREGRSLRKPLVEGADRNRVYYYTIFPSLLLSLHPDYVMAHYVRPLAANRSEIICEWLFDSGEMARPDFDPSDAVDFWDVTNRQDWAVNELTQLGTASRSYLPGPYAQQEGLLHAFDRHYLRTMR